MKIRNMIKLGLGLCLATGIFSQAASASEEEIVWTGQETGYSFVTLFKDGIEYDLIDCKEDKYTDYAIIVNYSNAAVPSNGVVTLPSEVSWQGKTYPIAGAGIHSVMPEKVKEVVVPEEFGSVDIQLPGNGGAEPYYSYMQKGKKNFFSLPNVPKVTVKAKNINIFNLYWELGDFDERIIGGGLDRLESLVLESDQVYLSKYALTNIKKLKEVSIKPDSSLTMESYSVINCDKLKKLSLPVKTDYHEGAIIQCDSLNALEAAKGSGYQSKKGTLYSKDTLLFVPADCISYQVGADVKRIGRLAFANCSKLKKVSSRALEIGDGAFMDCKKLSQLRLKKTKSIGDYAFAHTGIRKITLPATLKKMGCGVFLHTKSLKFIRCSGKYFRAKDGCLLSKNGKQLYTVIAKAGKISIPKGVKRIYGWAISNPASVKEIILPASLKKSGSLGICNKLKKLTFEGKKTPVYVLLHSDIYERELPDLFDGEGYLIQTKQKITVAVPKKTGKRYQKFFERYIYLSKNQKLKMKY